MTSCLEDADQLGAALCAVAGMDFFCGRCLAPDDLVLAIKEGWIWVREGKKFSWRCSLGSQEHSFFIKVTKNH